MFDIHDWIFYLLSLFIKSDNIHLHVSVWAELIEVSKEGSDI